MVKVYDNQALEDLRERVRSRLDQLRISEREASRRAGFNVGYLGDFLTGRSKRGPGERRIIKLAEALEMSIGELVGKSDSLTASEPRTKGVKKVEISQQQGMVPLFTVRTPAPMNVAFLPLTGEPVGMLPTLPALEHVRGAYAFTIPNDMNSPRYMAGEVVYISPAATPRVGDFIFIRFKDGNGGVARLTEFLAETVAVEFIGATDAEKSQSIPVTDIEEIHRIIGAVS